MTHMMDRWEMAICEEQGQLFERFAACEYDAKNLVKLFMTGDITTHIDAEYCHLQWAGEAYWYEELTDTCKDKLTPRKKEYRKEALYWMGYVYRYWHFFTGENSKEIYKQAPFDTMDENYYMFHTLSLDGAVLNLKEMYRQKQEHKAMHKNTKPCAGTKKSSNGKDE